MGMSRVLRAGRRRGVDRHDPPGARPGRHLPRHGRHVRPGPQRGARRPGHRATGASGSCSRRSSATCAARTASFSASTGRPSTSARPATPVLKRLGVDVIDLYYQHRVDPQRADRGDRRRDGRAGRRRARCGTSGCRRPRPTTLRRACAGPPDRRAADRVFACGAAIPRTKSSRPAASSGIGFVAYSPLGRGFLTGRFKTPGDFRPSDWRRKHPRFAGENFSSATSPWSRRSKNSRPTRGARPPSSRWPGCSAQGEDVVPIPGTQRTCAIWRKMPAPWPCRSHADDLRRIEAAFPAGAAAGLRYHAQGMQTINR